MENSDSHLQKSAEKFIGWRAIPFAIEMENKPSFVALLLGLWTQCLCTN